MSVHCHISVSYTHLDVYNRQVYGVEQIPVNMIERVEVVRGGGSALFGANAVGGTHAASAGRNSEKTETRQH